jgi:hypothetical protein
VAEDTVAVGAGAGVAVTLAMGRGKAGKEASQQPVTKTITTSKRVTATNDRFLLSIFVPSIELVLFTCVPTIQYRTAR